MRWRTAPAPWQKRFLHYRWTTALHLQDDRVAVKVAANDNEAFIAVAIVVAVKAVGIASTLAATGLLLRPAGGDEVEFLIGQLDGVSEIGHLLHVGLLWFSVSGGILAVIAATLSLAARRQSGCTAEKSFLCGTARRYFFIVVLLFFSPLVFLPPVRKAIARVEHRRLDALG
jgi:hypothetical protein